MSFKKVLERFKEQDIKLFIDGEWVTLNDLLCFLEEPFGILTSDEIEETFEEFWEEVKNESEL